MQTKQMTEIQSWLQNAKGISAELEGHRLTYHVSGRNDFSCRLMLLQAGRTLSWYGYTLVPVEVLNESPHRAQLDSLLLHLNDELFLGRWAVGESGMLLFDVSLPVDEHVPSEALLSQVFDVLYESFDNLVSMIKFFLKTGRRVDVSHRREGVQPSAMTCLTEQPDLYPLLLELKLLPVEFDSVLRKVMPLPLLEHADETKGATCQKQVAPTAFH